MSRSIPLGFVFGSMLLLWPGRSSALDLDVSPVRVHLTANSRSELLAVRNRGNEAARYQIQAFRWRERPDGETVLEPTDDLVVFPSLVEIEAGQTQRIRVMAQDTSARFERSYRILLEPLPDQTSSTPGTIRVLTRFSIPIFVQPRGVTPEPEASVRVQGRHVRVWVTNVGSSYFVSRRVELVGRSTRGEILFRRELPGWYVLAEGERVYDLDLPETICADVGEIAVSVTTTDGSASASAPVDGDPCAE